MALRLIDKMKKDKETTIVIDKKINFWAGKTPCWESCHCPEMIKEGCPVSKHTYLPCWEIEGTYCKLDDLGITGTDTSICEICRVYKKYGKDKPIQIRLFGKGFNASIKKLGAITRR
jgi:hypothetical protein